MREKAVVVVTRGSKAKVEIVRTSACDHCKACSVGRGGKTLHVWVDNPLKAEVGKEVEIEMKPSTILSAIFMAYGIPLIGFLIGIAIGLTGVFSINEDFREIFSLLTGLFTMALSFLGVHLFSKRERSIKKYTSNIVNILD